MSLYDQLFKELFEHFFDDLLHLTVPWLAERVDQGGTSFLRGEFHTDRPHGRRRTPDLVARVASRDGPAETVLVHVEVEGRTRRSIGRRMWEYAMLLWLRHRRPVVPILVQLRGGKEPGVVEETVRAELWGRELASFRYFAFYLARNEAADFVGRPEPLAWALAALMRSGAWPPEVHKLECIGRIARQEGLRDFERFLLANCVETCLQLEGETAMRYQEMAISELDDPRPLPKVTWAERMRWEGVRHLLATQIEHRFGASNESIRGKLEALDGKQLERLGERLLDVESLADLGLS